MWNKEIGGNLFRGISELSLDDKGRLAMPSRYRVDLLEKAEGQLVVTIDTEERCLLIYPQNDWFLIEQQIEALPSFNKAARRVQRLLLGHATEVNMDNNGRLLVPPPLREYAKLDKQIVLIGQGKKFELWDEKGWLASRETWLEEEAKDREFTPDALLSISL